MVESSWESRKRIWGEIFFRRARWSLLALYESLAFVLFIRDQFFAPEPGETLPGLIEWIPAGTGVAALLLGAAVTLAFVLEVAYRAVRNREKTIDELGNRIPAVGQVKWGIVPPLVPGGFYLLEVENEGSAGDFSAQIVRLSMSPFLPYHPVFAFWIGSKTINSGIILNGHKRQIKLGDCEYRFDDRKNKVYYRIGLYYIHPSLDEPTVASTEWQEYDADEDVTRDKPAVEIELTISSQPDLRIRPVRKRFRMSPKGIVEF